jgi:hypothetical protein
MPKFMVTHTLPPKGLSRDQFCQVSAAAQKDPNVKGLESFANLTEGKIYRCRLVVRNRAWGQLLKLENLLLLSRQ